MKKVKFILLCSLLCLCLTAQNIKTASQLDLTNKGLYLGVSTSLYIRGGISNPYDFQSRSMFDAQYRFANQFSAGLSLGYDYVMTNSYLNYTSTRLSILPEFRYWPHKEPQRIMPYLFINYGWINEKQSSIGYEQTSNFGMGAAGAGCTGWLNSRWGLQLRGDILTFRKNDFLLISQPFLTVKFGIVFKTNE